ncbi:hypothetical protein D3C71_1763740 [compost metagenome]
MDVAYAVAFHHGGHVNHRSGNRRGSDRNLRGHDGGRQRTARFDALLFRHFGNDRECCEGDVAGTGKNSQEVGDNWRKDRDVLRVFAQ